jgi:hypothetical protein
MKVLEFVVIVVIVVVGGCITPLAYGCAESPISIVNVSTDTVGISLSSLTTIQIVAHDTINNVAATIVPGEGYEVVSQPAQRTGLLLPGATGTFTGSLRLTRTGTTVVTIEGRGVGQDGRQIMSNYRLVIVVSDTSAASYSISDYISLAGVSSQALAALGAETIIYTPGTAMAEPLGADSTWSDDSTKSSKGTFGVRGYLFYHDPVDPSGVLRPAVNVTVEVWDSDDYPNGDDRLGATITNWNGYFEKGGLDNSDGLFGGSADPYLKYKTVNSKWGVASTLTQEYYWWYSYRSFSGVSSGSILDFGQDYIPEQSVAEGAMWIHQFVNLGWNAVASAPINDDPGTVTCGWPSYDGSKYVPYFDAIYVEQNDADAIDVVNHEYGHFLMDHAYNHNPLPSTCPSSHSIPRASNEVCAWDEGWPTFFTQVVRHDNTYDFEAYNSSLELEHEVYAWDWGPSCEGRVARALVDLWDTNNDYGDQNSAYPVSFYDIYMRGMHSARDNTFRDFWDRTKGNIISYPEAYCGVRSIANNTIEFVGAMRGDCNADNSVDVSDVVYVMEWIFSGGSAPIPYVFVGDVNCDDEIDISDAVFLISFIFSGDVQPCPFQ